MERRKLVIIGAGGASFTQGFIADVLESDAPWDWELSFVDINPAGLATVSRLAERMAAAKGKAIKIEASTDRRAALRGANAVVVMIAVGGRDAWRKDVEIPRRHGIYMTGGETCGPGGISRALRMIPAIVDIARDVSEICPDAIFVNYSNPLTPICLAVEQEVGVPMIGICAGVACTINMLAVRAGLTREQVDATAVGLNHCTWVYRLEHDGQDAWPRIEASLRESGTADNPFCWELWKRYRAFPSVNDHHAVEFFMERFPEGKYYGQLMGVDCLSYEWLIGHIEEYAKFVVGQALGDGPIDEGIFSRRMWCQEELIAILTDIWTGRSRRYSVNLPNDGAIANLPTGAVIERHAFTTPGGFASPTIDDLPGEIAGQIVRRLPGIQMTVDAALAGRMDWFAEAMLLDGAATRPEVADALAKGLVEAHAAYLPQFKR